MRGVAPFTGAWIEISPILTLLHLKVVAPFTGAWIEILLALLQATKQSRRSLHGGVD